MKLLKSIFISSYMTFGMLVSGYATWMLLRGGSPFAWMGVLLTTVPILAVFGRMMVFRQVARTSAHFPLLNLVGFVGVGVALWNWLGSVPGSLPATLAGAGWAGFLLYSFWYSRLDRLPSKIAIGSTLPEFTVRDLEHRLVRSAQLTGKPTVLLFYRGNWCPLCMAQIKELAEHEKTFVDLGVRVALISPQPHTHTAELARKHSAGFEFFVDEGNHAARALGISDPHGIPMGMQMLGYASETVLPTLIITDKLGTVIWIDQTDNYRVRPEPEKYLEILRTHNLVARAA